MDPNAASPEKTPAKKKKNSTFPKERLYELQKNYRERKKQAVKNLERTLEATNQQMDAEKAVHAAALKEIVELKLRLASFRVKLQATSCELEETKIALNLVRLSIQCNKSNKFSQQAN